MIAANGGQERKCPVQRNPDRKTAFSENGRFWWSADDNCWMISPPEVIAAVLQDQSFCVHSYKFNEVAVRLGISLPHHEALRAHLPLAVEGGDHAALRQRFNSEISANTARALEIFKRELGAALGRHFGAAPPSRFCAVAKILRPSIRAANLAIAGLDECNFDDLESLPLFFDEGISLRKRQELERLIGAIHNSLPPTMNDDEKYFRVAMLALSINTLLGSISESFLTVVRRNHGVALSTMDWDRDLPATGLPVIERKAVANTTFLGRKMKSGDRVRLFVDVDEFDKNRGAKYTELYFAAGSHRCPGMNYSRKIWNILVRRLREIDRKIRVCDFRYRPNDGIFSLLDKLEIETYV